MRKVADLSFSKKVQMGSEASKSRKYEPLGALVKNLIHSDKYIFSSIRKCEKSFDFLQKQHV